MARRRLYRIGQLALRCGVSPRTVDYYTDLGLLAPCRRTAGNYRLYAEDAVEQVILVRALREQGWTLAEIRDALAAPGPGLPEAQLARLQALVRAMQRELAVVSATGPRLRGLEPDGSWRDRVTGAARELVSHATLLSQVLAGVLGEGQAPVV